MDTTPVVGTPVKSNLRDATNYLIAARPAPAPTHSMDGTKRQIGDNLKDTSIFGDEAASTIARQSEASGALARKIAAEDEARRSAGVDDKARPAVVGGAPMPGMVEVDTSKFTAPPVWAPEAGDRKAGATVIIGGVNGTWHTMEGWVPDLAARTAGPVYAFEGPGGPGSRPHNIEFVKENVKTIADGLRQLSASGVRDIDIQTYSMGGIVGQAVIQELQRTDPELKGFDNIRIRTLLPPNNGFAACDALHDYMPKWLVDTVMNPVFKKAGVAMSSDMGPSGEVFNDISNAHSDKVQLTAIKAVGDSVSTASSPQSVARAKAVEAHADAKITLVAEHSDGLIPASMAAQGVNPFVPVSQTSALAVKALESAKAAGVGLQEFEGAQNAFIVSPAAPKAEKAPEPLAQAPAPQAPAPEAALPASSVLAEKIDLARFRAFRAAAEPAPAEPEAQAPSRKMA